MRITHVMQHPQGVPDLADPGLEHFITERRRTNRAAKEEETIMDNWNLRWQGRTGIITGPWDERKGLGSLRWSPGHQTQ